MENFKCCFCGEIFEPSEAGMWGHIQMSHPEEFEDLQDLSTPDMVQECYLPEDAKYGRKVCLVTPAFACEMIADLEKSGCVNQNGDRMSRYFSIAIRIAKNPENGDLADIYETVQWRTVFGDGDPGESLEYEGVPRDAVAEYLLDDMTIGQCMTLMEPYAEWLPIWLYDHSGITMSCGTRTGQYADRWDSGQVGWIIMLKKTIMDEVGTEYVLDDEGEMIRVEHKHPDAPSTWSYLTRPLTDETWRKRAIDIMKADVEVYDQYLTGDVYGFNLYSAEPVEEGEEPEWDEEDSCWGFFGSDVMENGIEDHAGNGLREAVESGRYEQGRAVEHSRSWFTF